MLYKNFNLNFLQEMEERSNFTTPTSIAEPSRTAEQNIPEIGVTDRIQSNVRKRAISVLSHYPKQAPHEEDQNTSAQQRQFHLKNINQNMPIAAEPKFESFADQVKRIMKLCEKNGGKYEPCIGFSSPFSDSPIAFSGADVSSSTRRRFDHELRPVEHMYSVRENTNTQITTESATFTTENRFTSIVVDH